jgi:SAM-dependent methyltransferase
MASVADVVSEVRKSSVLIAMLIGCVTLWPIILLAHMNAFVGQVWYWAMFALVERFWLKQNDHAIRVKLFEPLADECRKKEGSGSSLKVLEIGPGVGGNFGYYPSGLKLTTLEQNPWLQQHVESVNKSHPNLVIEKTLIGNAEHMDMIEDSTFDAVIGTHVLCCIRDKEATVKEIHRILKMVSEQTFELLVASDCII